MNTLVIHPDDRSTDFLKPIYENIKATVVTGGVSKHDVLKMIYENDRVIMMGHGSPSGLFSVGRFPGSEGYIIDEPMVQALSKTQNNLYIWCNADKFVERYKLKGFYSGMFISEVSEAYYCGLQGTTQEIINESNNVFAQWLGKVINKPLYETYFDIIDKYGTLAQTNPVAQYNNSRLYLAE